MKGAWDLFGIWNRPIIWENRPILLLNRPIIEENRPILHLHEKNASSNKTKHFYVAHESTHTYSKVEAHGLWLLFLSLWWLP